ncbi:hypothetical protein ABZW44_22805 [Streptomyces mirabilis]|uniref:hypothetical protein n=1 Tax=Streptomyces mirabilis TaxID=68239 RepID=UPI0033B43341
MSDYPESAARFARDAAGHEMTVLHDDGLYRHLKFMTPGHGSIGAFQLITWPYNLVVKTGWTFHFDIDATEDMFDLFRRTALTGQINPGYWSEKVRAGRDEVEGYSDELLKKEIEDSVQQWVRESKGSPSERRSFERQLRAAVHGHFFDDSADYNVEYESEAYRALHDFSFAPAGALPGDMPWHFADFYEWRMKDYTPGYLHSCFAIRHGIDLWDAASKTAEVTA